MKLLSKLTGGRPMRRGDFLLHEPVLDRDIYEYTDAFGRKWMAHSAWAWFRVPHIDFPSFGEVFGDVLENPA